MNTSDYGITWVSGKKGDYWFVRLDYVNGKPRVQKIFSVFKYGSKKNALVHAKKFRDENISPELADRMRQKKEFADMENLYIEKYGSETSKDQWKKERLRRRIRAVANFGTGKIHVGTGVEGAKKAREMGASQVTVWKIKNGHTDFYQPSSYLAGGYEGYGIPLKDRHRNRRGRDSIKKEKPPRPLLFCSVPGCGIAIKKGGSLSKRLCNAHNLQIKRKGCLVGTDELPDLPNEEWKAIPNAPVGYFISNMGRVKRGATERLKTPKILHPFFSKRDGMHIILTQKTPFGVRIGITVANLFLENPRNNYRIRFVDGDNKNCKASNIQWLGDYWYNQSLSHLKKYSDAGHKNAMACYNAMVNGDNELLGKIIWEFRPRLRAILYKNAKPRDMAHIDDIISDTTVKSLDAIRRGLLRQSVTLEAWITTIAKNTLKNAQSNKHNRMMSLTPFEDSNDEMPGVFKDWGQTVKQCDE